MSAASVQLEHVGVGCNRVVHALHWGDGGLLAYGGQNAVVVYHPEEARVLGTLLGHTDLVTCVRWLPRAAFPQQAACGVGADAAATVSALASGSGDCTIRIWLWTPHTPHQPWRVAAVLQGHATPITSVTTHPLPGGGLLLVSTAGDGDVLLWECDGSSSSAEEGSRQATSSSGLEGAVSQAAWRLRQRIGVGHQLQHCAAVAALPADPDWLLLALGGVDGAVRLYCCPPGGQFESVCKLTGHQDWIRGLAFAQIDDGRLLLASASQDKNVRVWAVTQQDQQQQQQQQQPGQASSSSSNGITGGGSVPGTGALDLSSLALSLTRYAPKPLIHSHRHTYAATLESLLIGHEDWVHSVAWHPPVPAPDGGGTASQPACLLTASMDRTMMLWRPDPASGLWMSEEAVGDAGANHLGYYSGVLRPDGRAIAAHGFTGALHIWQRGEDGGWLPQHALGGHFAPVVDACWAADGACLLTASIDQTTRISTRRHDGHWCEIARPQVHGHDFSTLTAIPCCQEQQQGQHPRYLYACGSEEKVVRVFEAPAAFLDTLAMARGRPVSGCGTGGIAGGTGTALGALLPALGLSNKAVYREDAVDEAQATQGDRSGAAAAAASGTGYGGGSYAEGPDMAPSAAPSAVQGPPLEEHLAQNTLWPEVHKLYGHGSDLYCMAADPKGRYVASACRAQAGDSAAIWLWDTARWTGAGQLPAHTLTVTQLAFSPDGRFLASASRDRTVAVFERQPEGPGGAAAAEAAAGGGPAPAFRLVERLKAHARIVWGLHWSPDSRLLATCSRDGKVKVWSVGCAEDATQAAPVLPSAPIATMVCGDSVRSVQFAPACLTGTSYHLAAGLESGALQLLHLSRADASSGGGSSWQQQVLWEAPLAERHAAAVRRLCWRRDDGAENAGQGKFQLASCSDDHSLRVFAVSF